MKIDYYKKSGIMLMNLARDFFLMAVGDRISTIYEYTNKFHVSRGIVQNAIETLEQEQCIGLDKRGVKGTYLTQIDYQKLYTYTNWGTITGTMAMPLSPWLSGLTTAICDLMEKATFPFSFAYVTGSERRLEAMEAQVYDFMIVTKNSAKEYLDKYDFLNECVVLDHCVYSAEHILYFMDASKSRIEDGMRIGVDPKCLDQYELTKKICKGKDVTFVEFPYVSFDDLTRSGKVDCVVYRDFEAESGNVDHNFGMVPLSEICDYNAEENTTPVVLTNKNNYGIDALLHKFIDVNTIHEIQEEVFAGRRGIKFY